MKEDTKITAVTTKDSKGKEHRISVRQISNGWVTTINCEYKDAKGNWQYETKEEYSEENPLDPKMVKLDIIKEALGKK